MPHKNCAEFFRVGGAMLANKGYNGSLKGRLSDQGGSRE